LREEKAEGSGLCREKAESKRQAKRAPDYEWKTEITQRKKKSQDTFQLQVECLPTTLATLIKNSTNKQTNQTVFFSRRCFSPREPCQH